MKRVFLFDLDGTLCESRKTPPEHVVKELIKANQVAELGILTGSDLDFLQEQCEQLFIALPYYNKVYAMACNGTKAFEVTCAYRSKPSYKLIAQESLATHLGEKEFNGLMKYLVNAQADLVNEVDIPLTGNFITCRGSTINWCPIGRGANDDQRARFVELDKSQDIRVKKLLGLKQHISQNKLKLVGNIAGDTSFDIYPESWDKTYAMRYFPDHDVYFWGDRMFPDGNDHTMHLLLGDRSFPVTDPDHTATSVKQVCEQLRYPGNSA